MLLLQYLCAFFALRFRFMTITFLVLSAAAEAYYQPLVLEKRFFQHRNLNTNKKSTAAGISQSSACGVRSIFPHLGFGTMRHGNKVVRFQRQCQAQLAALSFTLISLRFVLDIQIIGVNIMVYHMMQIEYTREAIKNIAETGSNRDDAVRLLIQKCGGKLINFYGLVRQEYNIVLIVEFNDLPNYLGMALSGVLGGAIADWKTVQLFAAEEMVAATETYRATKEINSPPPSKQQPFEFRKKRVDEMLTKASCEFLGSLISYFFTGDPIQGYVACFLI